MKKILSSFFSVFPQKKKKNENGTCARCNDPIPPYATCCIIGYDSDKGSHPRAECNHIICFNCINILKFEPNAIHVSNSRSVPTLFFTEEKIKEAHRIAEEIHKKNRHQKIIY